MQRLEIRRTVGNERGRSRKKKCRLETGFTPRMIFSDRVGRKGMQPLEIENAKLGRGSDEG